MKIQQSSSEINKDFSTCQTLSKRYYHGGRDYTVHAKQRKKTPNELSVFLKTSFIFVKNVQITVLKTYMESALVRYNSDLLSSQRSEPQQLQRSPFE